MPFDFMSGYSGIEAGKTEPLSALRAWGVHLPAERINEAGRGCIKV
jgi:hypothetical protein